MHKELLTTAQVAERLGVSPSAVSRMAARKEITPQIKAPGVRGPMFFTADEVERVEQLRNAETRP